VRVSLAACVLFITAAAAPTPQALLTKLLSTPMRNAELPLGFTRASVSPLPLTANGRKYGAIGKVGVVLHGPDPDDELVYEVFPDSAHAIADLRHPAVPAGSHTAGAVTGLKQSTTIVGSITVQNKAYGVTDAASVTGTVLIQAITLSATSTKHGDTRAAVELLRAGIAYVQRLNR
jgi:hypothetical protein